ncbi:GNAT family N-acetyltransferase [Rhodohalobacter sulfatireducens]|uniref:GNAT family N-acetyltransferase n=1 Tax=Rhodohalobacter sulfatireducens TaxID=2911366 RepID=A0ABS9KJ85_9BACT|nr:GNAT family N-acetyltransferase [Rhodohalobacter sulfatireducens]MCG2590908.1 GNAT family N-acetyltransferase [Rhodohalobacter sulfatireducens]
MDSLPVLETDRLRLRMPYVEDIPRMVQYANNEKISNMTLTMPHPYHEKDAIYWINMANKGLEDKNHFIFAICKHTNNLFMGCIGLRLNTRFNRAELGFWIGEPFWNNGYVTEAIGTILEFGFERVGLHKIHASHFVNNPASGKVMSNNGMIKEGELVDHIKKGDKYLTVIQYRLTKYEYKQSNS